MAATKVARCNCQHEFQDKQYGKGMRLMNVRDQQKHKNEMICTVCGAKHNVA